MKDSQITESTQLSNSEDAQLKEISMRLSVLEKGVNSLTNLIKNSGSLHALEIVILIFILFWLFA